MSTGTWYHYTATYDDSTGDAKLYVNGNLEDSATFLTGNLDYTSTYDAGAILGAIKRDIGDRYGDGNIDDVVIFDRVLSSSEIEDLYNYGFTTPSSTSNFTVSVTDMWDGTGVNNITVTINGTTYTNTTGNTVTTDILTNSTSLYDITVEAGDYFTENYTDYNVSSNLNAELAQNNITFETKEIITNNTLSSVNYTIDGETLSEFPLSNGTYNVTATKEGYYSITKEFNITILEEKTITLEGMYDNIINLSITDTEGNSVNTSWSNTILGSGSVINGSDTIQSLQGNNFSITLGGDDFFEETVNAVTDTNYTLIEKNLFSKNQIYINFKKLSDQTLITEQINYTITSDDISYEGTTTSGSMDNIVIDGNYKIIAESSTYKTTSYIFNIPSSPSGQNITLYLIEDSGLSDIEFIVIDNFDNEVKEAIVNIQQQINGTSYSLGQQYTDFTGSTVFQLDTEKEYNVIATKEGYDVFTGTFTPTSNSYTLRINDAGAEPQNSIFENIHFQTAYDYDNNTVNFTYFLNSADGSLQEYSVSTTYDGTVYSETVIDTPSGSIITLSIPYNVSVQNVFEVDYSFTTAGETYSWNETYTIIRMDSYDTDFSDFSAKTKVVIAVFVMVLLVAIGIVIGGIIGGHLGGIIGLGLLTLFQILNVATGVIGLVLIITIVVIMKRDGDMI